MCYNGHLEESHHQDCVFNLMELKGCCLLYKLLSKNRTINFGTCYAQLDKLNAIIYEKRPKLVNRKDAIFFRQRQAAHIIVIKTRVWCGTARCRSGDVNMGSGALVISSPVISIG